MKWIAKFTGISALIIVAAIYGYSVGKYEIFPYSVMYDLKKKISPSDGKIKRNPIYENKSSLYDTFTSKNDIVMFGDSGFAPIFPDICYHLTHYKPAAADIPV
ncbi:hypothetical protein RNP66_23160, partial [Escherichia coli]|nr:hypothetical protein [Escherichia coli]